VIKQLEGPLTIRNESWNEE